MGTTRETFEGIISERGIYKTLNLTEQSVKDLRRNHKKGKVTIDLMEAIIVKAGYKKVINEDWKKD